jgi:hypothetical protein
MYTDFVCKLYAQKKMEDYIKNGRVNDKCMNRAVQVSLLHIILIFNFSSATIKIHTSVTVWNPK